MKKQSNWSKLSSGTLILVLFCGDFRRCIFDKITPDGVDVLVYNGKYFVNYTLTLSHRFVEQNWIASSATLNNK